LRTVALAALLAVLPRLTAQRAGDTPSPAPHGKATLRFEANRGQTDPSVRFLARGKGYSVFLTPSETVLAVRAAKPDASGAVLRLRLEAARAKAPLVGGEPDGRSNYFLGNDPRRWLTDVPNHGSVRREGVYPGVDVVYHGRQGELEYDFVIAPGAHPEAIRFSIAGAESIEVDPAGDLVLRTAAGPLRQRRPFAYQTAGGERRAIPSRYVRDGGGFGFEIGEYDRTRPLVIDPGFVYSTYLGGGGWDAGWAVAIDGAGNAYVTGVTDSINFPPVGAAQPSPGGSYDAFVTKLGPSGTALVYSTYLGGGGFDQGLGIAVDAQGAAYVTGYTSSPNFPTAGPTPSAFAGSFDAFVTKLDPTGSAILLSRYLGGAGADWGYGVAVDAQGAPYVAGWTTSSNFPVTPPPILQATYGGGYGDAFVTKLEPSTLALAYSTYLGGTNNAEAARGVGVDQNGQAYVAGYTASTDFPVKLPAVQATYGGTGDGFVAKLDRVGATLVYSTYLGGSAYDTAQAIAVDRRGNAYVTGFTLSANFPTKLPAPLVTTHAGAEDAFVTRLDPSGALVYSRFLGGSGSDLGSGIGIWDNLAVVTGETSSPNFPVQQPIQPALAGSSDAFVTRLNGGGFVISFSTYLGGTSDERGLGIAVADRGGAVTVVGGTASTNFPTAPMPPLQAGLLGIQDAFVTRIVPAAADIAVTKVAPPLSLQCLPLTYTITVTNNGPDDAPSVAVADSLPAGLSPTASSTTSGFCTPGAGVLNCDVGPLASGASATVTVTVVPSSLGTIADTVTVSGRPLDLVPGNNAATATTFVWRPWWCGLFFPCPVC
jgi:uncharacterized repeat protein (TIGR01451 family)